MSKPQFDIHEPTGRPLVRGLPVPYVTRWTGEQQDQHMVIVGLRGVVQVAYHDDPLGLGRIDGLLWSRDGNAPRSGEPEWKGVHALRHRSCMLSPRCQVCGKRFPAGQPVTVLHAVVPDYAPHTQPFDTSTPPTCRRCAPWAKQLCPNLRASRCIIAEAATITPIAVCGNLFDMDGQRHQAELRLDDPLLPLMQAKQLVVRVADYTVHEVPTLQEVR